jgi:hypothetical protein
LLPLLNHLLHPLAIALALHKTFLAKLHPQPAVVKMGWSDGYGVSCDFANDHYYCTKEVSLLINGIWYTFWVCCGDATDANHQGCKSTIMP